MSFRESEGAEKGEEESIGLVFPENFTESNSTTSVGLRQQMDLGKQTITSKAI